MVLRELLPPRMEPGPVIKGRTPLRAMGLAQAQLRHQQQGHLWEVVQKRRRPVRVFLRNRSLTSRWRIHV